MQVTIGLSWSTRSGLGEICHWRIYASRERRLKGRCIKTVPGGELDAQFVLKPGLWYLRAIAVLPGCREEPWKVVDIHEQQVNPREDRPSSLRESGIGPAAPGGKVAVGMDPPTSTDRPYFVELIQAPVGGPADKPGYGKLIAEHRVSPGDATRAHGRAYAEFPLEGMVGPTNAAARHAGRRLMAVPRSEGDVAGAPRVVDTIVPERPDFQEVVLADVNTAVGAVNGFPGPGVADTYVHVPGSGYLMRTLPAENDAGWGAFGPVDDPAYGDRVGSVDGGSFTQATIPTNEFDLGGDHVFSLQCLDEAHRDWVTNNYTSRPVELLSLLPTSPDEDRVAVEDHVRSRGTRWAERQITVDGDPSAPLRFCRWEFRVSQAPLTGADLWQAHTPGLWLRGRYVQARLLLEEPTGFFRVATGNIQVSALYQRRTYQTTVAWPGGPLPPPGQAVALPVHPITGGPLFPNAMNAVATCRGAGGLLAHFAVVSGTGGGAAFVLVMVHDLAMGGPAPAADSVDLVIYGY